MLQVLLSWFFGWLISKYVKSIPTRIALVVPAAILSAVASTAAMVPLHTPEENFNSFGYAFNSAIGCFFLTLVFLYITRNAGKPKVFGA
tara:strand:- start:147 stop:413 length:267 start_codon:yes stop_codon:yes gene_type:complete